MNILDPDSLIRTVDHFNEAVFREHDWRCEADSIVNWVSDQLGGGYAGSFAMTENDWKRPFQLFTGEKITTRAGRSHVLAQETNRMLEIIEKELGTSIEAKTISETRLARRIFEDERSIALSTGDYCCGTCSVSLWRCLEVGGYPKYTKALENGIHRLAEFREEKGGWRRFPFYYTLLCLTEVPNEDAVSEIRHQLPTILRRKKMQRSKDDRFSKRRCVLLDRIVA
jgi:hypothetical protein